MEEQSSWKGHTFTLMIFGGIVVLCSIFFVLGMMVGRTQSQKAAAIDVAVKPAAKDPVKDERPELKELKAYDFPSKTTAAAVPETPVVKREDPAPEPPPPPPPVVTGVSFQVSALAKRIDAEKLVNELKKKGFTRAFMLTPAPGDPKPVFRVQVGPIADSTEAESTRLKLVAAGYSPIKK